MQNPREVEHSIDEQVAFEFDDVPAVFVVVACGDNENGVAGDVVGIVFDFQFGDVEMCEKKCMVIWMQVENLAQGQDQYFVQ